MRRCLILLIPLLSICALLSASTPEQAVIKITNFSQDPDWTEPWRFSRVGRGTGSGFVIEGNRIMTNAHVVSLSRQILVQRYQDPRQYVARIEFIGHDCDLAVLTVDDPKFFEGITPFEIGDFPIVRSTVTTYGYPSGGQQISYTRGVISRIEMRRYVHAYNKALLTVQTDAAINPGNSGGPAIQEGKVVGVSFQGNPSLENAGFFIPPNVIRHFIKDIEDGTYHGFPEAGLRVTSLQSPAFREALGLADNDVGARIDAIMHPFPKTHELLKTNDVLLAVSGYQVGSDAMIQFEGNRVKAAVIFDEVQHGDSIELKIWRDKQEMDIALPLFVSRHDRLTGNQYAAPPYLIVGGLVFTEFSRDYLTALGKEARSIAGPEALYELVYRTERDAETANTQPIVLSKILKHPSNVDFGVQPGDLLTEVNGRKIGSMQDLASALHASPDAFHRFKFLSGRQEALNIESAAQADSKLLTEYNIQSAERLELTNE